MTPPTPAEQIAALQASLAEALKFLGHDAREGHSSTIALLELQRIKPDPMTAAQLTERVEANARKSLAAIDDFTDLARARTQPLQVEEIDLLDLMVEVVADAWSSASRAGIRIQVAEHPEVIMGWADRELLAGALAKLLRDAVAQAPRGTDILCALQEDADGGWVFEILTPAEAPAGIVPQPDRRGVGRVAGPGAGRLLAQVVAERHGGTLESESGAAGRQVLRCRIPAHTGPVF